MCVPPSELIGMYFLLSSVQRSSSPCCDCCCDCCGSRGARCLENNGLSATEQHVLTSRAESRRIVYCKNPPANFRNELSSRLSPRHLLSRERPLIREGLPPSVLRFSIQTYSVLNPSLAWRNDSRPLKFRTGKYTHQQQSQQHLLHFESILLHLLRPPPWHCLLHHCHGNFVSSSKIVETAKANLEHFDVSVLSCGIVRWLKMKISSKTACALVVGPHSWYFGLLLCQTLLFNTGCSIMQRLYLEALVLSNFDLAK